MRWPVILIAPLLVLLPKQLPAAQPPPPIPIGQSVVVRPGQTVMFAYASMRASGVTLTIPVTNQGEEPATVVNDGTAVTLTLAAGLTITAEVVYDGPNARVVPCTTEPGAPHIARCTNLEARATQVSILFSTTATPAPSKRIPLVVGCNNVSLTWPDLTATAHVAGAITPSGAMEAIWRLEPSTGRFVGWSPVPNAPNDLPAVRRLDAVFICMRASGSLLRPSL